MTIKEAKVKIADEMNYWYGMAYLSLYDYVNDNDYLSLPLLEKTPLFKEIFDDGKKVGLEKSLENHRNDLIKWGKTVIKEHTYDKIPNEEAIPISWLQETKDSPEYKYLPELKQAIDLILDCWEKDKQKENSEFVVETPSLEEKETEERDL